MSKPQDTDQPFLKLKRFLQPRPQPRAGERCEFCGVDISDEHSHVVNLETRGLLCVCRPCALLFTHEGAARGKYKVVPRRYVYAPGLVLTAAQWEKFQIPVGIAFFFFNTSLDRMAAFYPGPAGATESLLPLETWAEVVRANPVLESLTPDVEALLVYDMRKRAGFECYMVPIDACYELVGRIRRHWKGFDGGEEAWEDINAFFVSMRAKSEEAGTVARSAE